MGMNFPFTQTDIHTHTLTQTPHSDAFYRLAFTRVTILYEIVAALPPCRY